MNSKASVSKDLEAKHSKILEGLLKLPQNRECADCRSRAPRWASVNLGIFICMQCSGIHRNLGVHISKVRSTTLDTWLPEQVALMQSVGNEKANKYWEAELPPNSDRSKIEKFIRSKYEERRWVPKNSTEPASAPAAETSFELKSFGIGIGQENVKNVIPKKTRKFSLDEEILTKHMTQIIPPPIRSRTGSVDMTNKAIITSPPPKVPSPVKKTNGDTDHFDLLHANNVNQDHSTPSRWATFD